MFESQQNEYLAMTPEMAPASAKPRGWAAARLFANHIPDPAWISATFPLFPKSLCPFEHQSLSSLDTFKKPRISHALLSKLNLFRSA
jgi:hypothetical protein